MVYFMQSTKPPTVVDVGWRGIMSKQSIKWDQEQKVVRLRLDAGFFFERAVRSLDRNNYEKALKYFRLAVDKEPENPINHCNLAGVLSEMGRFSESNKVLQTVVDHVDPELYECYFYMANNAANMENLELAEKYLCLYLAEDPHGEYAEDAEEMLEVLAEELGRAPRRPEMFERPKWLKLHDEARQHLEEGRFLQAIDILEDIIKNQPDFLAARNNLALAYYYIGRLDDAIEMIQKVLQVEPYNLHALCNLAIIHQYTGEVKERDHLICTLKKLVPYNLDNMHKLATTMGILGEHEIAYFMFRRLLKSGEVPNSTLYHSIATAAWNCSRYQSAKKYWRLAEEMDPESGIPSYFLAEIQKWLCLPEGQIPKVSYQYQLPFEQQIKKLEQCGKIVAEKIKYNPMLRSSFCWALNYGDDKTKTLVLQVLGWIADQEVEQVLRNFLLKPNEKDELKRMALFILFQMGADGPYQAMIAGKQLEIGREEISTQLPTWIIRWNKVLESCLAAMEGEYDETQMNDAQILWAEFLNHRLPSPPIMRKEEGWAAAIEYIVAKMHGISITQAAVARKYCVSPSTVSHHIREISQVCISDSRRRQLCFLQK